MAAIFVVVAYVGTHESNELTVAEDEYVLEELSTTATDPALSGPVLPRTAVRDANRLRAHRPDELDHGGTEYGVAVKD